MFDIVSSVPSDLASVRDYFQVVAAYSQHPCHQHLFMLHQAISVLVQGSARGEMSPRDDATMQRID